MWKRFKKRVNNWMFEEILEDDTEADKTIKQARNKENRSPETKVTYEYPKETSFPFPVIADDEELGKPREYLKEIKEEQVRTQNHRPKRRRRQINRRSHNMKDIQDIPTYLRRKRDEKPAEPVQLIERKAYAQFEKDKEQSFIPHTSPEELDAIFKKRHHFQEESAKEKIEDEKIHEETPIELKEKQREEPQFNRSNLENDRQAYKQPVISDKKKTEEKRHIVKENEAPIQTAREELAATINNHEKVIENQPTHEEEIEDIEIPYYLLDDPVVENREEDERWIKEQIHLLERTLTHFNVEAEVVHATQGSSVTRFEVKPAMGVKVSRIRNLVDDIKLNLAAKDIRIEAPIPGKHTVGIEVPNKNAYPVGLQEIIQTDGFINEQSPLAIALGLTIEGEALVTTVNKMPHCLIAGATGSGKSVCINTILLSLIYKAHYDNVKFLLIDPKMVELSPYNGIPYLISPVITDVKVATASLKWAVNEMEERYELFAKSRVRDISRYNTRVETGQIEGKKMPYIVIVIDELADLMSVSPQDVEDAICRIAQKARACGIHLILATQRPSVDVITGLIKANIPTRISFSVTSQIDSRTIIDTVGAEKLLGKGDMLFLENGSSDILRLQGPFVSDDEIERITGHLRSLAEPTYLFEEDQLLEEIIEEEEEDELLEEVIHFIVDYDQASTSLLQRRFRIGYNRAARIIDTLEARGIISGQNGTKPRDVLMTKSQLEQL